jgi:hypothetical protein
MKGLMILSFDTMLTYGLISLSLDTMLTYGLISLSLDTMLTYGLKNKTIRRAYYQMTCNKRQTCNNSI